MPCDWPNGVAVVSSRFESMAVFVRWNASLVVRIDECAMDYEWRLAGL